MSTKMIQVATCDQCGLQTEIDMNSTPKGWHKLSLQRYNGEETSEIVAENVELCCPQCVKEFMKDLTLY